MIVGQPASSPTSVGYQRCLVATRGELCGGHQRHRRLAPGDVPEAIGHQTRALPGRTRAHEPDQPTYPGQHPDRSGDSTARSPARRPSCRPAPTANRPSGPGTTARPAPVLDPDADGGIPFDRAIDIIAGCLRQGGSEPGRVRAHDGGKPLGGRHGRRQQTAGGLLHGIQEITHAPGVHDLLRRC